ncbi:hypothetical protein [Paenibacillus oryzisoli]|uniref:Uncharacterized protein n=1 Tax=Paenibacillus oryzisoli TaxID=1850517 RepID=A0A198A8G1_9BACL|nr:hypothetical protein [Paenibacillus oryzisoli]OAS17462.1 hypothetical protein A8708_22105 [Paenibacillus oryzisoli]
MDSKKYELVEIMCDLCKGMSREELLEWKQKANALPEVKNSNVLNLFNDMINVFICPVGSSAVPNMSCDQ